MKQINLETAQAVAGGNPMTEVINKANQASAELHAVIENMGAHVDSGGRE